MEKGDWTTEFSQKVPRDLAGNKKHRAEKIKSTGRAALIEKEKCRRDLLYWINTYGWLYEPRTSKELPFITYPFQERTLLGMLPFLGEQEMAIAKSRDMGATWMLLYLLTHQWQFEPMMALGLISSDADLVDKTNEPDALFWKLDFILSHQPSFLLPKIDRQKFSLVNVTLKSTFTGVATTEDAFRGGRKTAIMVDEAAKLKMAEGYGLYSSIQQATNCIIWNSTPKGRTGIFADRVDRLPPERLTKLHWSEHPVKAEGLYYDEKGKARSPWYDKQCEEIGIPVLIAQELDLDFAGSQTPFYPEETLRKVRELDVRDPFRRGFLSFDPQTLEPWEFKDDPRGNLLLWVNLDGKAPPGDRYAAGVDVSAGTGATPTCLAMGSYRHAAKVAEIADARLGPVEAAHYFIAVCKWFGNAKLCWESGGPAAEFSKRVLQAGYSNIYWRRNEESASKKMYDTPGWSPSGNNKVVVHTRFRHALGRAWLERSAETVKECGFYIFTEDSQVEHARHRNVIDPSGAKENHGDRVIATALCWFMLEEMGVTKPDRTPEVPAEIPIGSLAWRREQWEREKTAKTRW